MKYDTVEYCILYRLKFNTLKCYTGGVLFIVINLREYQVPYTH